MPHHSADRPTWNCRACGEPWPCASAQVALRAQVGETQLRIDLWTTLEEAVGDLTHATGPELFQRFFAWAR